MLVLYAEMLCEAKVESELGARVDALLTEGEDSKAAPALRSQRLFLLKNMERRRGCHFVRSSLHQAPLAASRWLSEWVETGELGLIRFLGINKMPRSNPFLQEPLWSEAHSAVLAALAPTGADYTGIESLLLPCEEDEQGASALGAAKAALLMACFHECFLCISLLADLPKVSDHQTT